VSSASLLQWVPTNGATLNSLEWSGQVSLSPTWPDLFPVLFPVLRIFARSVFNLDAGLTRLHQLRLPGSRSEAGWTSAGRQAGKRLRSPQRLDLVTATLYAGRSADNPDLIPGTPRLVVQGSGADAGRRGSTRFPTATTRSRSVATANFDPMLGSH
jgi:hypothetical protein